VRGSRQSPLLGSQFSEPVSDEEREIHRVSSRCTINSLC
jgi:hypothetical protein